MLTCKCCEVGRDLGGDEVMPEGFDDKEVDVGVFGAGNKIVCEMLMKISFASRATQRGVEGEAVGGGCEKCGAQGECFAIFVVERSGQIRVGADIEQ